MILFQKKNGGDLDSQVVRPFLSQTPIPCSVFIVWGAKGVQRAAEREGTDMEYWSDSGLVHKMYQYSHGNAPNDFQRILLAVKRSLCSQKCYIAAV